MGEGGQDHALHVVGEHEGPAHDGGQGLRGAVEGQGGSRGGAQLYAVVPPGGGDYLDDIVLDGRADEDCAHGALGLEHVLGGGHGLEGEEGAFLPEAPEDGSLVVLAGVAEGELDEEAVELGLWEREGALELDGVLGGEHHEGAGQGGGVYVDRDLALFHGFEEGRLGAGTGPVDLVGQHNLAEYGAAAHLEPAGLLVVDGGAGYVGGEQVGGELDAVEGAVEGAGEGLGEGGLADAGHVFDEHVPLAEQGHEHQLDLVELAHDHPQDAALHVAGKHGHALDLGAGGGVRGRGPVYFTVVAAWIKRHLVVLAV